MNLKKTIAFLVLLYGVCFQIVSQEDHNYAFTPGFYHIMDYPINIRSEPGLHGVIIGKLYLYDEIEVIENSGNEQQIENVWSSWYKIKFNDIIGYIFGGYIAEGELKIDIDDNDIDDYLFWRYSGFQYINNKKFGKVDSRQDVIIYINGKRISTEKLNYNGNYIFYSCSFYSFSKPEIDIWLYFINETYTGTWSGVWFYKFIINKNSEIYFKEINGHE